MNMFSQLGIEEILVDQLSKSGIHTPSPIQKQAIPILLKGQDAAIIAPTGTGKTLAYLLPLLQQIDGSRQEVQAIVLGPTQELAMQIAAEAEKYGSARGIKTVSLIGGASLPRQVERLKGKPDLIVGTPGRVQEVLQKRKLSLHKVQIAVVDEVDRILDLGGREKVDFILKCCARRTRQTLFATATYSAKVKEAEGKWQNDPWKSQETGQSDFEKLPKEISHWMVTCDQRDKIKMTLRLIRHLQPEKTLLFVNASGKIGTIIAKLRYEGLKVNALYGDITGRERADVLQRFRQGKTPVLLATDVAARGLDVQGLSLVIQLEPALDKDHYIHRVGRTGRMNETGVSILLIDPKEQFIADKLQKQLAIVIEEKKLYEGQIMPKNWYEKCSDGKLKTGKSSQKTKENTLANKGKKSQPSKPLKQKSSKIKAKRPQIQKDKGAPKWLKEKRQISKLQQDETNRY